MSEGQIDKNENELNEQPTEKIILKPKKERTKAQIEATERMVTVRKQKAEEAKQLKEKLLKEEEDKKNKIKEKLTERIVKNAINLDKKEYQKIKLQKKYCQILKV